MMMGGKINLRDFLHPSSPQNPKGIAEKGKKREIKNIIV
jgi:hypothetical protein